MRLQHMARTEHQHAARQDRHFLAGLRVAADTAALLTHREGSEPADLDGFSRLERRRHPLQHRLQQVGRLVPGQADLGIDRLGQMRARDGLHPRTLGRALAARQAISEQKSIRIRMLRELSRSAATAHMRTRAEPQVRPPPSASISTRSPRADAAVAACLGKRQRHRGRRGIGVPIHGDHHPLRRQAELAAHGVDDAPVGLVRHQPIDVARGPGRWRPAPRRPPRRGGSTAWRNTSRPFITRWPGRSGRPTAPSTYRMSPSVPWACRWVDRMPRSRRRCRRRRAGTPPRRRRRTARRCRGPASSGCASRPRCRSPARRCAWPVRIIASATDSA